MPRRAVQTARRGPRTSPAVLAGLLTVLALFPVPAAAAVTGRYVRLEAMCRAIELSEVELFSEGTNLLRGHPELITGGTGYGLYGPLPLEASGRTMQGRQLTDGYADPSQRTSFGVPDPDISNAYLEIDLGQPRALQAFVFHVSRYDNPGLKGWFGDPEGWRVVSVLDDQRRVVFSREVTMYTPEYLAARGIMRVEFPAPGGPLAGREVPAGARAWFSLGEFLLNFLGVQPQALPDDPDRAGRVAEFAHRDDPGPLKAFATDFFAAVDLARPGQEAIRRAVTDGDTTAALEQFKRRFLAGLTYLDCVTPGGGDYDFVADRHSGALMAAEDLLQSRKVDRGARRVLVARPGELLDFSSTVAPWQELQPRCLLLAYAATGDRKYLTRWAELMDEWSLFYQRWADAGNRREYFPLNLWNRFIRLGKDLREAGRLQPRLVDDLPAATLARFLAVVAEEYPPAYWRLARKTVFNHQFNTWGGAYLSAHLLRDFYTGERLQSELEQHFERLWTLALTRDGSMIEVADEGHLAMPLATAAYIYLQMKVEKPAWFTPELETWFLHRYRMLARYLVRFISPQGLEHRSGQDGDYFGRLDSLLLREPDNRSFLYVPDYATRGGPEQLANVILREPEVRAILDTVYGRGRGRAALPRPRQAAFDTVTRALPGGYQGPPQTVSDYMPYAGIHYLRRDWSPDAAFVEMLCQPHGGSANDRFMDSLGENWWGTDFWDTQFHYWDFGEPLLLSRPLLVDEQNQCQSYETKGWKPGSKTERLTEAPEKPLPNRFHCSPRFDYQECAFSGAYQNWALDEAGSPLSETGAAQHLTITAPAIIGVHTTRQIFQLREERLFIVVDRVRFSDAQPHQIAARYLLLPRDKQVTVTMEAARGEVRLTKPTGAQLTLHQFGPAGLQYERLKPLGERQYLRALWPAQGETVVVSLLEPQREAAAPATLDSVTNTSDTAGVGFVARTHDGRQIEFRVPARLPQRGTEPVPEQALLAVKADGSWQGLTLGPAPGALRDGTPLPALADSEFALRGAQSAPAVTPLYRPIDPPTILPAAEVFVDRLRVSLASATPGVELRYTTDGSEPTATSPLYAAPFEITTSCLVQARAFRPGQTTVPFVTAGTRVSDLSFARFAKQELRPALKPAPAAQPGLAYDYLEGSWFRLFGSADRLAPRASGVTPRLLEVTMRQTDGPFAVRYHGYLTVPAAGLYTFHAPPEYVHNTCEPGYDLRVFVDGEEWRPGQWWHGLGEWSVPLEQGAHRLLVVFADARAKDLAHQRIDYWRGYPSPWVVWTGTAPALELSGPGLSPQPVPAAWLTH